MIESAPSAPPSVPAEGPGSSKPAGSDDFASDPRFRIRPEEKTDRRSTEELVRDCFWNLYGPGCTEHYVLHRFRHDPDFVTGLDLVLVDTSRPANADDFGGGARDGRLVGHVMAARASLRTPRGTVVPVLALGPLCVAKSYQKRGLGRRLVLETLGRAKALGLSSFGAVFAEGNPGFLTACGFGNAGRRGLRRTDSGGSDSGFLVHELSPGFLESVRGSVYHNPRGYFAFMDDPVGFQNYDRTFPPRRKALRPTDLLGR